MSQKDDTDPQLNRSGHAGRGLAPRVALRLLHLAGCDDPTEAVADLSEEARVRRNAGSPAWLVALWTTWQWVVVCAYELRDRRRRPRSIRPGGVSPRTGLHPRNALKLAVRQFRREPGSAISAALTLALGFGASAAIFSVIIGFTRDLPVPNGEQVVQVRVTDPGPDGNPTVGIGEYVAWLNNQQSLDGIGAFRTTSVTISGTGVVPARLSAAVMTPEAFRLLRVSPALGRLPDSDDRDVVLLSQETWRTQLSSDPDVLGRTIRVGDRLHAVAGVMPTDFAFPFGQQLWLLLDPSQTSPDELEIVARLKDGISTQLAAEDLERILAGYRSSQGEASAPTVEVEGFTRARGESGENVGLMVLLLMVVALLLVSCANVSNILLVRAVERSRSLAVHAALGAGPRQIVLQMFSEALLIATAGGVAGLALAYATIRFIEGMLSGHWGYYWMRVEMNPQVLLFIAVLATLTALVSGTLPAIRAARTDIVEWLTQKNPRASRKGTGWASWVFLTGQVAFSCVAIMASALMAGGLLQTRKIDEGFPADSVLVASFTLDGSKYSDASARRRFQASLIGSLSSRAQVRSAALSTGLPGLNAPVGALEIEGLPAGESGERPNAILTYAVTPAFFDVFDLSILNGRRFFPGDGTDDAAPIAIVSEDFVRRHLVDKDPIGQRLRVRGVTGNDWVRIVGVVSDVVIYAGDRSRPRDRVYLPLDQVEAKTLWVTYRGSGDPDAAMTELQQVVARLDPTLPLNGSFVGGPTVRISDTLAFVRRIYETAGTLAVLAGLSAILVTAIGLYGILSFEVQRSTREIGIRMALGAARTRVLGRVLKQGLVRVAPGLMLGLVLSYPITPIFGLFLSGMDPHDPRIFASIVIGYVTVALAATVLPARRAASLDPSCVLRNE